VGYLTLDKIAELYFENAAQLALSQDSVKILCLLGA
jgi:hypothetical protein